MRQKLTYEIGEIRERFKDLFEYSLDLIYVHDLRGKFLEANDIALSTLGFKRDEISDISFSKLIDNDQLEKAFNVLKEIKEYGRQIEPSEYKLKSKCGNTIYLETYGIPLKKDGKVFGILGIAKDITAKKQTKQKLKQTKQELEKLNLELENIVRKRTQKLEESEKKYRSVLKNINEGYFEVDLKGNFTFFNDSLCESSGYSREELLNKNYSIIFDDETSKKVYSIYNELYHRGEGSVLFDYQIIRKDGRKFYHESSVYLRTDPNGEIVGFKGFIRDISERKKGEALRKKFSRELEKEVNLRTKELKIALDQQKLYLDRILKASHFKTEFLATISHELRTPLNVIIGFTDLLLEGVYGQLNSKQLEFIKDIEESSKHLLDMISNILDISKIESGEVTLKIGEIKLYETVQQVISTLNPLCSKKDLNIELKGIKREQLIFADRIKFKQIIYNLLRNAIKFTEKGSILFEFLDNKDNWEFNVIDTGIGIAEEDFSKILQDFKRVKSTYVDSITGSGLGLALTKRIVNLHGGEISFTSKLGKGSKFAFNIPKNITDFDSKFKTGSYLKYLYKN